MHALLFKLLVLIPLLALLGILTYKKINESFDNQDDTTTTTRPVTTTTPQTTVPAAQISTQLTTGIADTLGISVRRITNLSYSGDINSQQLSVSFTVIDTNLIEASRKELSANEAAKKANSLFTQGQFIVPIDGINIRLEKINKSTGSGAMTSNAVDKLNTNIVENDIGVITPTMDLASYFNNQGLLDTANYATQIYDTVPIDSAATRFFTLKPDSNFNLMPVLSSSENSK